MGSNRRRLTREEIYVAVWERPTKVVALDLNVSDVALAKICRKLNVPRPGLGYWAKRRHGKDVAREVLPPPVAGQPLAWAFPTTPTKCADGAMTDEPEWPEISLADDLRSAHRLVKKYRRAVEKFARAGERRHSGSEACLAVEVGKANVVRGLRVADALLRAFDALDWETRVTEPTIGQGDHGRGGEASKTEVLVEGEWVSVSIEEKFKQEKRLVGTYGRGAYHEYVWKPQGTLSLKINDMPYGANARKSWNDTAQQKVEECLASFLRGLVLAARATKAARLERERRKREREEAEHRWQEEKKREQYQEQLVADVQARLDARQQAERVRALLRDLDSMGPFASEGWAVWAAWYVDRLEKHARRPLDATLTEAAAHLAQWLQE